MKMTVSNPINIEAVMEQMSLNGFGEYLTAIGSPEVCVGVTHKNGNGIVTEWRKKFQGKPGYRLANSRDYEQEVVIASLHWTRQQYFKSPVHVERQCPEGYVVFVSCESPERALNIAKKACEYLFK